MFTNKSEQMIIRRSLPLFCPRRVPFVSTFLVLLCKCCNQSKLKPVALSGWMIFIFEAQTLIDSALLCFSRTYIKVNSMAKTDS